MPPALPPFSRIACIAFLWNRRLSPLLVDVKSSAFGLSIPISNEVIPTSHIFLTTSGFLAIESALTRALKVKLRLCSRSKSHRRLVLLGSAMKLGSAIMILTGFPPWYFDISKISSITFFGERHLRRPRLMCGSQQKLHFPKQPRNVKSASYSFGWTISLYECRLRCRAGKGRMSKSSIRGLSVF